MRNNMTESIRIPTHPGIILKEEFMDSQPKITVTVLKKPNKQQPVQLTVHKSILTQKIKNHELKRSFQNQKKRHKNK